MHASVSSQPSGTAPIRPIPSRNPPHDPVELGREPRGPLLFPVRDDRTTDPEDVLPACRPVCPGKAGCPVQLRNGVVVEERDDGRRNERQAAVARPGQAAPHVVGHYRELRVIRPQRGEQSRVVVDDDDDRRGRLLLVLQRLERTLKQRAACLVVGAYDDRQEVGCDLSGHGSHPSAGSSPMRSTESWLAPSHRANSLRWRSRLRSSTFSTRHPSLNGCRLDDPERRLSS